jgi:hypothetical protein
MDFHGETELWLPIFHMNASPYLEGPLFQAWDVLVIEEYCLLECYTI